MTYRVASPFSGAGSAQSYSSGPDYAGSAMALWYGHVRKPTHMSLLFFYPTPKLLLPGKY